MLLEAESAGIMDDVDMTAVEKLILDPETKSRRLLGDVDVMKLKSNVQKKLIDDIELDGLDPERETYDAHLMLAEGNMNTKNKDQDTSLMAAAHEGDVGRLNEPTSTTKTNMVRRH